MGWTDVCAVEDVGADRINAFDAAGKRVLLHRSGGEFVALDAVCSHEEVDLGLGFYLAGRVTCPSHSSQFDLRTGEALSPPAEAPLRRYPVRVDAGRVLVDLGG